MVRHLKRLGLLREAHNLPKTDRQCGIVICGGGEKGRGEGEEENGELKIGEGKLAWNLSFKLALFGGWCVRLYGRPQA